MVALGLVTDRGQPEKAFFFKNLKPLGLGRQIGPKILRGILGIFLLIH